MRNGNYGYWLWDESAKVYRCSICNHFPSRIITHKGDDVFTIFSRTDAYRYCPTCGVKMKYQLPNQKMTFQEVQATMILPNCLMKTEDFLRDLDNKDISSYDGVGDLHDGHKFVTNGFETDIFKYIIDVAFTMTREEFVEKYPYVAWYNK